MSLRRSGVLLTAAMAMALATDASRHASAQQGNPPPVANLAAKYRLVERFTTQESKPGYVGQYQVKFRETISSDDRGGYARTIQFSERPAAVPDDRRPTEIVRHYDSFQVNPPVADKAGRRLLDGLTIWCRDVPGKPPLVISLTPNRPLEDKEYEFAITNHYVSRLNFVLGVEPVRIADSWRVGFTGVNALTNLADVVQGELTATLSEVRPHPGGNGEQAVIDISGRLQQQRVDNAPNETAVRARLLFAFTPTPAQGGGDPNLVDCYGAIEKVSLAQVTTTPNPKTGKDSWIKRELELDRRFPGSAPLLTIPEPPPTATVENSWLTGSSANKDFSLRHPQDFDFQVVSPTRLVLLRPSLTNPEDRMMSDFISFDFYRTTIQPEAAFDTLKAEWKQKKLDVLPGRTHRLPEVDWPGLAVHQMTAVLKTPAQEGDLASPRRYCNCYVVQFTKAGSVVAFASTFSERNAEFEKQVEAILRTLKVGAQ